MTPPSIPRRFCWTKFGTESGESVDGILARKERERAANGGTFLWGIGNSVAPGIKALVRMERDPMAVFSPMKAKAKAIDTTPSRVVIWREARSIDGSCWNIPRASAVLSRADSGAGVAKRAHYALVCHSDTPLTGAIRNAMELRFSALSNLVSGAPLGYSQVTSVVDYNRAIDAAGPSYGVGFIARLIYPYFVELSDPTLWPSDPAAVTFASEAHQGRYNQLSIE